MTNACNDFQKQCAWGWLAADDAKWINAADDARWMKTAKWWCKMKKTITVAKKKIKRKNFLHYFPKLWTQEPHFTSDDPEKGFNIIKSKYVDFIKCQADSLMNTTDLKTMSSLVFGPFQKLYNTHKSS